MIRATVAAFVSLALVASASNAQDASTRKAARAIQAQEKEVLRRITQRMEFDKQIEGATVRVEVSPGGAVTLNGSVISEAARRWTVDLVENTSGVTSVVDRLAVVKTVQVYEATPAPRAVEVARPIVVVPAESKIITRP